MTRDTEVNRELQTADKVKSFENVNKIVNNRLVKALPKQENPSTDSTVQPTQTSINEPIVAAFIVTDNHKNTKYGDFFTASGLGRACETQLGWSVRYLSKQVPGQWYNLFNVDVVVVLIEDYDLHKIRNSKPDLIRITWARNWFTRWAEQPCFDDYDVYMCSSKRAVKHWEATGKRVHFLPIAADNEVFNEREVLVTAEDRKRYDCDYCFTGSFWGCARELADLHQPSKLPFTFHVYGSGWQSHSNYKQYTRGFTQFNNMRKIYNCTNIVLDDANHVTKQWGSVNSRVFDALASGTLVLSNGEIGVKDLFNEHLCVPTFQTQKELHDKIEYYMKHPQERIKLAHTLQQYILKHHCYKHRALQLNTILKDYCRDAKRISIHTPVPSIGVSKEWGDFYFAHSLKRALKRLGHSVQVTLLSGWYEPSVQEWAQVVIVLRGLSKYTPNKAHTNIMWNISHPRSVLVEEYNQYDQVCVASSKYAKWLKDKLNVSISELLQCTDLSLFYPLTAEEKKCTKDRFDVLFIGNSRNKYRTAVKLAIKYNFPIKVIGSKWEHIISPSYIHSTFCDNKRLRLLYAKAGVLLNDHWDDMRDLGFISNRVFDAAACGANIVSDNVPTMSEVFSNFVRTFDNDDSFQKCMKLSRKTSKDTIQLLVKKKHTFDARAQSLHTMMCAHGVNSLKRGLEAPHIPQPYGFIVLRYVNSHMTNEYWKECVRCIRTFHPQTPIVIIDNNSNSKYFTPSNTTSTNITVISHTLTQGGEFLPYYYLARKHWFKRAVILHDSVFLQRAFPIEVIQDKQLSYLPLWHFSNHTWDNPSEEKSLIQKLRNSVSIEQFHRNVKNWSGNFGAMSIIDVEFLKKLYIHHDVDRLLCHICSRLTRMYFERIVTSILLHQPTKRQSLWGDIHTYCKWGVCFDEYKTYKFEGKPAVKVWTGR